MCYLFLHLLFSKNNDSCLIGVHQPSFASLKLRRAICRSQSLSRSCRGRIYQTGVCRFCCCLLVWTISLKLESLGTSLRGCWVASNGIIFNTRKNPLWRNWQHCTAVLRCFFWESRISIKGQNNNVLYWFNVEDNSDSCLFFFSFFFWYCFLVDPFHLSTVSTFFHCEPRLGLNHMGSKVPVLISACFWKHQLTG